MRPNESRTIEQLQLSARPRGHWLPSGAILTAVLLVAATGSGSMVKADSLVIDVSGWEAWDYYGDPNNSVSLFDIGAGSAVTGFDYDLTFEAFSVSYRSELVLLVENSSSSGYLHWRPSPDDSPGIFSGSGSWGAPPGSFGPFGAGGPYATEGDGILRVAVFDAFPDGIGPDAQIASGSTITVYFEPVPEPATWCLLVAGAMGFFLIRRRIAE